MSILSEIAGLRAYVAQQLDNRLINLFGWTLTAKGSAMGDTDTVQTDDTEDSQRPVRRVEPWGHRGFAPGKVRSLCIRIGSSNMLFLGVAAGKAYGPDNLEEGETSLYCSVGGTEIRLDKDGNVKLTPASGKTVQVAGDPQKLPMWTDFRSKTQTPIAPGTPYGGFGAILTLMATAFAVPMAPGNPVMTPAQVANLTDFAARLIAGEFDSTKATNG